MHRTFPRRYVLRCLAAATVLASVGGCGSRSRPLAEDGAALVALEREAGGRLGVCALDSGSARSIGHRADERFALCSTFKLLLAAVILREADAGRLSLDTRIPYTAADMVPHAPVTAANLAAGSMSIGALAEAAQRTSDNVAANLLLRQFGGPAGFTAVLREMGDPSTRLDRSEPEMNLVLAGELRDTTTPRAMAAIVARLFGDALLHADSRTTLRDWMIDTTTGMRRIRAGLPAGWIAGDKTGTALAPGIPNKHNDVAVIWLPQRAPIVIAAYYESREASDAMRAEDDAVLAAVGRIVAAWVMPER
jgi:beta-lactamase class A